MIGSGRRALTVDTEMPIEWTCFLCVRLPFFLDRETRFQNEEETKSGQISSDYTYTLYLIWFKTLSNAFLGDTKGNVILRRPVSF